jgi:hypothetical protein
MFLLVIHYSFIYSVYLIPVPTSGTHIHIRGEYINA